MLLTGETGTGKELFANAIHVMGSRKSEKFVHLNCSTIPSTLLEAELFGYKKGTFTDARQDRIGKIEFAERGTLFLDEIGNISLEAQAKLLRVIEYKDLCRLGENVSRMVDVRYIFATNMDLERSARAGAFRPDLFYRINIHTINIPPLRKNKQYITKIVSHYWRLWNRRLHVALEDLNNSEIEELYNYDYPGNIRELIGMLERIFIYTSLPRSGRQNFIRTMIMNKLNCNNYVSLRRKVLEYSSEVASTTKSINAAAKILEIDRKTLRKYIKRPPTNDKLL